MPLFGQKKTRSSRAATLRAGSPLARRIAEALRDRGVLLRLALCAIGLFGLLFAVEGWVGSFPYRLGDRAEHGVTARVEFRRVNDFETDRARQEAAEKVPPIFLHNPEPLDMLPARLRAAFVELAEASSVEELSEPTRQSFGLTPPERRDGGPAAMPPEMDHAFQTLQATVAMEDDSTGNRIDELVAEFERYILTPLKQTGVMTDSAELERSGAARDRPLAVVTAPGGNHPAAADPRAWRLVEASDVLLSELLKDTGNIGKSWASFPELRGTIRPLLENWLRSQVPPTLRHDAASTQNARLAAAEIDDKYDVYQPGDVLVRPGQTIDAVALGLLQAEHEELERQVPLARQAARAVTVFLMFVVLAVLNGYYVVRNEPQLVRSVGRLSIFLAAMIVAVFLGRHLSFDPWRAEIIPLLATVMIFAIAYNQVLATLVGFTLALIITLSTVADLGQFVVLMSVAAVSVISLARVPSRSKLITVGCLAGGAYFVVSWGTAILQGGAGHAVWADTTLLWASLKGAGWCLVAGYFVAGSLPFIEKAFGMVTDISLLEMSDVSHPLLHELVQRAPGTYNHSITVASIAEAAADRIGANGLLVRVGAYFHDVGKMLKPHYFIENMTDASASRHQHLAPAMSTLIIIGHVKDGVELARQHNLPEPLIDFIEQHHGTTLVEYFYHEATRQAGQQPDHKTDVQESAFRYPGPKPQSREAGVMMLADAVESASRALSEPTPRRIEGLVHDITLKRLMDGQFDDSTLTLSEIRVVEDSLIKSLIGIYHGRIKYPEQRTA